MYLYKTIIYKDTSNLGDTIDISQNNVNRSDFETNHKPSAIEINQIFLSETTFQIDLSYTDFSAKVVSPILWSDVKYIDNNHYELILLTDNLL